jgi:parvulin-like peptidyl-prolyl isomerase
MMQALRDNMKIIIWITAIIFLVGFGILELGGVLDSGRTGQAPAGIIAEINGQPVRMDAFSNTYNGMLRKLNRELQPGEDAYVREQAWQMLVRNTLMAQEARRHGIGATPEEIKMALRVAPPEVITEAEGFKTNGQFDYRKYLAELENPNSRVPWAQVEALVAETLPVQKLQEVVIAAAKVSEGDIRERFALQNERLKVRVLQFPPDSFSVDTTRIGDAELQAYYKAHPEEFSGPREVKVGVLLVPRKPDDSDVAAVRERLRGVLEEARATPDSFPKLALTYSDVPTPQVAGDPGTERFVDDMEPAIRNGLRNVAPGQVSDIVQDERGLHIFLVVKREIDPASKREKVTFREIVMHVTPGPNAVRAIRELATKARKEAEREGFGPVATRHGFRTFESLWFSMGQSGNQLLDRFPEVEAWMFQARVGSISRAVPSENGWFFFKIVDRRDEGVRPLDKIRTDVKVAVIRSMKLDRAREAAAAARAALAAGTVDETAALAHHGRAVVAEAVLRNGFLGSIGAREARVVGTLFAAPTGVWSQPLTGDGGVYVALVETHTTPTEEEFRSKEQQIRETLLNERRQALYTEWLQDVRRRAKIKDYRESYFDA